MVLIYYSFHNSTYVVYKCDKFPLTELFWREVSNLALPLKGESDDQRRINYALKAMNVTWDKRSIIEHESHGVGQHGFKVTALPQVHVCRSSLCLLKQRREYYIWHKGGQKTRGSKIHSASQAHSWFLRPEWENITHSSLATGEEWLQILARLDENMIIGIFDARCTGTVIIFLTA